MAVGLCSQGRLGGSAMLLGHSLHRDLHPRPPLTGWLTECWLAHGSLVDSRIAGWLTQNRASVGQLRADAQRAGRVIFHEHYSYWLAAVPSEAGRGGIGDYLISFAWGGFSLLSFPLSGISRRLNWTAALPRREVKSMYIQYHSRDQQLL